LHALIGEQEEAKSSEVFWDRKVLQLNRSQGHPTLQERQREAIEMAHVRITRLWFTTLKHERIAHDDPQAGGAAVPLHFFLLQIVERVHHRLQFSCVSRRDGLWV